MAGGYRAVRGNGSRRIANGCLARSVGCPVRCAFRMTIKAKVVLLDSRPPSETVTVIAVLPV